MFTPLVELAISKAHSDAEAGALHQVLLAAASLDEAEKNFADRINASKAARGEGRTKIGKAKQAELDQYAADAESLQASQLQSFRAFKNALGIINALYAALEQDVSFWSKAHTKAHAMDAAIVQEFASSKTRLRDAMSGFMTQYGEHES